MSKSTFFFWWSFFFVCFGVGLWFRVFTNWFSRATVRLGDVFIRDVRDLPF